MMHGHTYIKSFACWALINIMLFISGISNDQSLIIIIIIINKQVHSLCIYPVIQLITLMFLMF